MKHLKLYESVGTDKMRGYIFWVNYVADSGDVYSSYFMPIVAKNFFEASKFFIEVEYGEFGGEDDDFVDNYDEESDGDVEESAGEESERLLTPQSVFDEYQEVISDSMESYDTELWTGLNPRVNKPTNKNNYIHITETNPFSIIKVLDRYFTNVKEIMEKFPTGIDTNKWGEILLGDEDEMASYFKDYPLDIHLLDDQPEVKKRVLEKAGIRDLSRLSRNKKNGLL